MKRILSALIASVALFAAASGAAHAQTIIGSGNDGGNTETEEELELA